MLIQQRYETIDACRFCFMCRHVCTLGVVSGWEADTPRGKGLVLFKIAKGFAEYRDDLVETIYRCCQCGMCRAWCQGGYRMPETILLARQDIVNQGREPEAARKIRGNILETGNPFGLPPARRFDFLSGREYFKPTVEVLYYAGCDTAYHQPEIARAFVSILARAGVDFGVLPEETSSGKPLTVLGYKKDAETLAAALAIQIRSTGCKVLVTTCPGSYDAFRNDYAGRLDGIEVLHATEYIARLVDEGRLAPKAALKRVVAPQDSDYLCRYNGRPDAPRRVLASIPGLQIREMSWTREHAHSCGEAGGIFPALYPEFSALMARRMLEEASRAGAQFVATVCPVTKKLLTANTTGPRICDTVELFAESLGT